MRIINRFLSVLVLIVFLFFPQQASAHQPRIVETNFVTITNPEVSQAFYGELKGNPVEYRIQSNTPFRFYVGILVPDIPNVGKDISAEIYTVSNGKKEQLALLDGTRYEWTPFFEEFAKDNYFWGPEYKSDDSIKGKELKGKLVPAGDYRIRVFSPSNSGKYSLVTGFLEEFPPQEILKSITVVPQVKVHFFGESLLPVLLSPFGFGSILVIYIFAFIVACVMHLIVRKVAKKSLHGLKRNIGSFDRLLRLAICIILLIAAITTTWSPILLFFSGFALFEAIFSWCGAYAAIGKNTCPTN